MPSVSLLRHPQPQPHPHHHHTNLAKYPSPSPLPPHLVPAHPHPSHPVSSDPDYIVMDARDPRMSESLPSTSPISSYVPQDDIFSMSLAPSRSLIQAPLRPRSSPLIAPSSSSITDQLQHLSIKHEDDSWNQHQHDSINTQTFPWDQTCSQLTTQQPWIDTCDTTWDESTTSNTPTYSDRITPSTTLPSSASPSTSQSTWPHDQPSLSPSPTSASDEDHLLDDVAFGTPPHPSSSPDDNDELISATPIQRTIPHKHKRTSLPPLHINVHATARSPSPSPSPPPHAQHPHAHPHPIQPRPVLMIPQGMMLGLRMDEHAFARPMESPTHTRSSSLPNSTLFNRKTRSSPITITQTANTSPVTTSRRITTEIQPPARPSSRTTTYHRTGRAVSDITMTRDEATIGAPPSTPHTTPIANSRTITSRHPSAEALLMAMPTPPQTTTSTTPVMNDHCPAPLHRGSSILRSPPVFHPSSRCPPQDSPRRPHDSPLGGRRISGLRHASNADDVSPRQLPPIPIPSPPRPRRSPRRKLDGGVFEMEL